MTEKLYQQDASLIEGVGLVAHAAGHTSRRPAVARGAVYSVVDSAMTCYGSTLPGEEWCITACDVFYMLTKVVVLSVSV